MSTKTKLPEYVAQAVEQLRRIYEDRNPPTTFQERKKLTGWLHISAERDAKFGHGEVYQHTKAELLLKLHEAGVYILPITEHVNALYEAAKDRPQETATTTAVKPPKFQPTEKQKETAATLRRLYKAPRTSENTASQSTRNRATRALKHLRRIASEDAAGRTFPDHTDADGLYLEACRARAEGVKTPTLRGALDSVEATAYEAQRYWTVRDAAPKELFIRRSGGKTSIIARTKTTKRPRRETRGRIDITIQSGVCEIVGFVKGDEVRADAVRDLRVWDIACLHAEGEKYYPIGRVTAISAESITLRTDEGETTFERRTLTFEGRVNPEPIGHDDGLTDEQRDQLATLRKKLDRLGDEDDQIIRCSARYELEKKIYDIEHPVAQPYSADEWPDELRVCGE